MDCKKITLSGQSLAGKTAIALNYAYTHSTRYHVIFRLNAETTDILHTSASHALNAIIGEYGKRWKKIGPASPPPSELCLRIASELDMSGGSVTDMDSLLKEARNEKCSLERLVAWLPKDMPWLLILDGYEKAVLDLDTIFERRSPRVTGGHVLITSQDRVPYRAGKHIAIPPQMEHSEVIELLDKMATLVAHCCGGPGTSHILVSFYSDHLKKVTVITCN